MGKLGHFIAVNGHRFHETDAILASLESTSLAVQALRSQPEARRIKVVFFYNTVGPVPASILKRAARLGIDIFQHDVPSNGASLNLQIARAQEEGFDFYYRVDADDSVAQKRFVQQAAIMELRKYDIVGGGLIYRNVANDEAFSVVPPQHPRPIDYLLNIYMLHTTLAMDLSALKRVGLRYWDRRLEDKALGLAAAQAKLKHYNAPEIYGEYNLNPEARNSAAAAKLNLKLNLALLALRHRYWLMPMACTIFLANCLFATHSLRQWRNKLTNRRPGAYQIQTRI